MPEGVTPLAVLTDEELAALDPTPAESRLVVLPTVDPLAQPERNLVIATALRGLVARGWIRVGDEAQLAAAIGAGAAPASVTFEVAEHLNTVLQLRGAARRVVVAQRIVAGRRDALYLYDVGDEVALVELVEPTGLHHFAVTTPQGQVLALVEFLVLPGWEGCDGPSIEVTTQAAQAGDFAPELVAELSASRVLGHFIVRSPGQAPPEPALYAVHAGPSMLLAGTMMPGAATVALRRCTRTGLTEWLARAIQQSTAPVGRS